MAPLALRPGLGLLRCPVCWLDLTVAAGALVCGNRHAFDLAREGHVNLLCSGYPAAGGDTSAQLSIFAPRTVPDAARVLRRGGWIVVAYPGPEHLHELRCRFGLLNHRAGKSGRIIADVARWIGPPPLVRHRRQVILDGASVCAATMMGPSARHVALSALAAEIEPAAVMFDVAIFRPDKGESAMTLSAVQQLVADARVPGLSMAVIDKGQTATVTVAGMRNSCELVAVDEQTIFGAASLSKPLFAYAVLQLVDAGRLALDTPLSLHVPDYVADDPRAATVTARHVLSHTSGLPNWRSADLPLRTYFAPGERFSYCGEGFVWLQRVIEVVTGVPLDAALRQLIFEPLGMLRSSYTWLPAFETNYADPHDAEMEPGIKTKPLRPNTAASLQTTAGDYARFLSAVLSGAGLRRDTASSWLEPQVHMPDVPISWGLGWGLETQSGTFFQWGDDDKGRFKAFAMGSPQQRRAIAVFTNGFHGMAMMPALIGKHLPGPHPAFAWLGYPVLRPG